MMKCVRCDKSEQEVPLLQLRYKGEDKNICPQCLPVLIHKPAQMADKLPGLDQLPPPQGEH